MAYWRAHAAGTRAGGAFHNDIDRVKNDHALGFRLGLRGYVFGLVKGLGKVASLYERLFGGCRRFLSKAHRQQENN